MNKIKKLFNSLFGSSSDAPIITAQALEDADSSRTVETSKPIEEIDIYRPPQPVEVDDVFNGETSYALKERSVEEIKKLDDIRWTPDDVLYKKYEQASEVVGTIPAKLYRIKEARMKLESKKEQAQKILEKENLTPFDRLSALEIKQDCMQEEGKIDEQERELAKAQEIVDDDIFEQWAEYLQEAENFIKNTPEIRGIFTSRDILNSQGIYVKAKAIMDQVSLSVSGSKRKQDGLEKLAKMSLFFDLENVHNNAKGIHLLDFQKFALEMGDAQQHLFDRLDYKIVGIEGIQKFPLEDKETPVPLQAGVSSLGGCLPGVVDHSTIEDRYSRMIEERRTIDSPPRKRKLLREHKLSDLGLPKKDEEL